MKNKAKTDTLLVLAVFCVFAVSALVTLVLGVRLYEKTRGITLEYDDERTGLSYIWSKIKNGDEAGRVYITEFQGISALCLEEGNDSSVYLTLIYHYDGWVCELFTESGLELSLEPGDGAPIVKAQRFTFEYAEGGLIRAETDFGSLAVLPRAGVDSHE